MFKALAAQPGIEQHVAMREIIRETGATSPLEALTAVRALRNAMQDIMLATGATDTEAAVKFVNDAVLIATQVECRKMENLTAKGLPVKYARMFMGAIHAS